VALLPIWLASFTTETTTPRSREAMLSMARASTSSSVGILPS
jgi:hypothetical protein